MKRFAMFIVDTVRSLGLLLALGTVLIAVLAQGGRFSNRLDVLTHFAPVWLALAVAAAVLWLITGRQGAATPVAAGITVASCLLLMAPELLAGRGAAHAAEPGDRLKIVQFNVWGGQNGDIEATRTWILKEDPDIIILEEASGRIVHPMRDRYPYRTSCDEPNFCSTLILSKREPTAGGGLQSRDAGDIAGAWATYGSGKSAFSVIGVHYTWPIPAGPQQMQQRRLIKVVDRFDKRSLIVSGDFNSTPWSFTLRRQDKAFGLQRRTRALPSWPAAEVSRLGIPTLFPILPIDHVYAGEAWRTVSVTRGPRLGSDHYPVVVELARR